MGRVRLGKERQDNEAAANLGSTLIFSALAYQAEKWLVVIFCIRKQIASAFVFEDRSDELNSTRVRRYRIRFVYRSPVTHRTNERSLDCTAYPLG